jgi:hypothetical protein
MDRLQLSQGLIAFGGEEGIGKTRFTLKLANHIARKEKVLFLSYQDYRENLIKIIREMDENISPNLEVNTLMEYYGVGILMEIINYAESKSFTTLILDDLACFKRNEFHECDEQGRDAAVKALLYLANQLKIRLIFSINIYSSHRYHIPRIRDFNWSRRIINDCSQILALYRPAHFGITEDENGNSLVELIEVYNLKNEDHSEEVIQFDDRKTRIYNHSRN